MILLSYSASIKGNERVYEPSFLGRLDVNSTKRIFDSLGVFMFVCTMFVVTFFFFKKAPLIFFESWKDNCDKKTITMRSLNFLYKITKCLAYLFCNFELIYYLVYATLALVGSFYNEFFFAFHLTEIFIRYPYVIKAIWEPKKELFLTLILFLLFEYFFTVIGYVSFYEYYKFRCENIYMCFLETFDQTFKDNGAIGQFFEKVKPQTASEFKIFEFFLNFIFREF